jgi:hypothetical protein
VLDTKSPKYLEMAQGHISLSLSTSHKMEGKPSRERKSELKRESPPLAGVGEFICGRESKIKIMVEGKKKKRARLVLKKVG